MITPEMEEAAKKAGRKIGISFDALVVCEAAALAGLRAGMAAADGWVMVPKEPTEAMMVAGFTYNRTRNPTVDGLYHAMLAAAPVPPAAQEGGE